MRLNCATCNAYVNADKIVDYSKDINDNNYLDSSGKIIPTFKKYIFLKCPECKSPFIVSETLENESWLNNVVRETEILYPAPNKTLDASLSTSIKVAFDEALRCYQSQAYTACVIMCRKTIEGICKEYNIENGNLKSKIQSMKDKGIIDHQLFEWADALRLSGNDAAHDLDATFTEEDAGDIINFTYAIIEYIFVYKKRFEVFIQRKKIKK